MNSNLSNHEGHQHSAGGSYSSVIKDRLKHFWTTDTIVDPEDISDTSITNSKPAPNTSSTDLTMSFKISDNDMNSICINGLSGKSITINLTINR